MMCATISSWPSPATLTLENVCKAESET
jgi:hypothetical protein